MSRGRCVSLASMVSRSSLVGHHMAPGRGRESHRDWRHGQEGFYAISLIYSSFGDKLTTEYWKTLNSLRRSTKVSANEYYDVVHK